MNTILIVASTLLTIMLLVIYPLRLVIKKRKLKSTHPLFKINRFLRRIHKPLGVVALLVVYLHCRVSFNTTGLRSAPGVVLLVLMVLCAISWLLRKPLGKYWFKAHRVLALALFVLLLFHGLLEF